MDSCETLLKIMEKRVCALADQALSRNAQKSKMSILHYTVSIFTSQNHEKGVSQDGPLEALWPPEGPPRAPQSTKAPSGPSRDPFGTSLDPF